ncbi:hypothetical protein FHT44_005151 [Mycolicibacterium sp. BK634]|nr:hypothetical protein [Mycolicibacterium sp. BK634]
MTVGQCNNADCVDPLCDVEDGERCVNEVCWQCGNSTAAIGEQIAQAYRDGFADGRKRPRKTPKEAI